MTRADLEAQREDAQFLQRWRDGDSDAAQALLGRHFRSVYLFFANKVSAEFTDDLIQETFVACVESRDRIRVGTSFRAYLLSIARRRLYLMYRKRNVAERFDPQQVSATRFMTSPSVLVVHHEEQRILLDALRSISLEHQMALELTYWEHLSVAETAQVLDLPLGTLKSRLRRARMALHDKYVELCRSPLQHRATMDDLERWAGSIRKALQLPAATTSTGRPLT